MDKKQKSLLPRCCGFNDDSSSNISSSNESCDESDCSLYYDTNNTGNGNDLPSSIISIKNNSTKRIRKRIKKRKIKKKKCQSKWKTYCQHYKQFVNSPCVHFVYDAFFYIIFLMLFSYMVLCEFTYYDNNDELNKEIGSNMNDSLATNVSFIFNHQNGTNQSHTSPSIDNFVDIEEEPERVIKKPALIEYILIYWMISLIIDEIRQVSLIN
jgi:hypothetical protein